MKFLWIGEGLGPKARDFVLSNGGFILSGLVSEENLISGLDNLHVDMDSINSCQLSVTCNIRRDLVPFVQAEKWSRNGKSHDCSVEYRNIKYVDMIFRTQSLVKAAKTWASQNKDQESVAIIVYNMHSPYIRAALQIKKIIKTAKIFLIVTDLPLFMDLEMSSLKTILKRIDAFNMDLLRKKIDKYILYAEPMAKYLKLSDDQWMLMEGSYDSNNIPKRSHNDNNKFVVMYSGALHLSFGLKELLDAFELLDDRYELWLTGNQNGSAVPLIQERAAQDKRIKYFSFLPSRQDVLDKQASSTMLINMRRPEEIASKYCFPSKIFEYLASGRPVISCKLDGIPEEYYKFIIQLPDLDPENIANTIKKVASIPPQKLDELGSQGRKFILDHKNKYEQSRRIKEFIEASFK